MLIRVVDFETTGLDPEKDGICEVGWTDVGDGEVLSTSAVVCNPGRPIPPEAMAVHHITDAEAARGPEAGDVLFRLVTEDPPEAWCAHNDKFEQNFWPDMGASALLMPWICTWKCAMRIWPEAPGFGNQVLKYWLKLYAPNSLAFPPHRAGPDSYVTALILQRMIELKGVEQLAGWSLEGPRFPRIPLGKHRGEEWAAIPWSYLDWVAFKSDIDPDIRACAVRELERRDGR